MLSIEDKVRLIDELIKENKFSNLADYAREVAEIEEEINNITNN